MEVSIIYVNLPDRFSGDYTTIVGVCKAEDAKEKIKILKSKEKNPYAKYIYENYTLMD